MSYPKNEGTGKHFCSYVEPRSCCNYRSLSESHILKYLIEISSFSHTSLKAREAMFGLRRGVNRTDFIEVRFWGGGGGWGGWAGFCGKKTQKMYDKFANDCQGLQLSINPPPSACSAVPVSSYKTSSLASFYL